MTLNDGNEHRAAPTPAIPPDLRLRGEQPRVTRLSRKVLIGMGCVSALAVAAARGFPGKWAAISDDREHAFHLIVSSDFTGSRAPH